MTCYIVDWRFLQAFGLLMYKKPNIFADITVQEHSFGICEVYRYLSTYHHSVNIALFIYVYLNTTIQCPNNTAVRYYCHTRLT